MATLTLCRCRIQSNSRDEPLCTQCKIIYDDDYPQKLLHYCNDQDEDLLQRVSDCIFMLRVTVRPRTGISHSSLSRAGFRKWSLTSTVQVQGSGLVLVIRNKEVWFHDRKDGSRKKRFQR